MKAKGERTLMNITKEQLINLLNQLTHSQFLWNDCVASEDRGTSNHALCIVLFDDGSGYVGAVDEQPAEINVHQRFDKTEELADYLIEYHDALEEF